MTNKICRNIGTVNTGELPCFIRVAYYLSQYPFHALRLGMGLFILHFTFFDGRFGGCTLYEVWMADNGVKFYDMGIWCGLILFSTMCGLCLNACCCFCIGTAMCLGKVPEGSAPHNFAKKASPGLARQISRSNTQPMGEQELSTQEGGGERARGC